jgi:hypothetical protein
MDFFFSYFEQNPKQNFSKIRNQHLIFESNLVIHQPKIPLYLSESKKAGFCHLT